jgi:hypothetical protein
MVVGRKIVHLLKIVLAGKICFQNCPPALSLDRWQQPKKNAQRHENTTIFDFQFFHKKVSKTNGLFPDSKS